MKTFLLISMCVCVLCICAWQHTCLGAHVDMRENLKELVLSVIDFRGRAQVVRLLLTWWLQTFDPLFLNLN